QTLQNQDNLTKNHGLCSLQMMVLSSPVCRLQGVLVQSAHHLLRDLGGPFPVHCVKYNANISFPDSVLTAVAASHAQCHQVLWVLNESLDGARQVFENHSLPEDGLEWDEVKFDNFQNLQYQLLGEWRCSSNVESSDVLSSYFKNVTAVLQQQDSAACGWMALRRDLLCVLKSALQQYHSCFTWRHH
uniref:Uncharacterized protein n=1 Tax=Anabas testudineus TaxID=64144 RepID=A0A3Q1K0G7_ANATE